MEHDQVLENGHYRAIPKEGTNYRILEVTDGAVEDSDSFFTDSSVQSYLNKGYTFTRVYPIHLPEEMMEWVHSQALTAALSDDDVIEEAIRRFMVFEISQG